MRSVKFVFVILIATTTLFLTACPYPVPPRSLGTRENIDDNVPAFIKEGVTTREEVLMKLGEPDAVGIDDSWVLYVNGRGRGGMGIFMAAGGGAAVGMMEAAHYRRLIVYFNAGNIVVFSTLENTSCFFFTGALEGSGRGKVAQSQPCVDILGTDIPQKYNWLDKRSY